MAWGETPETFVSTVHDTRVLYMWRFLVANRKDRGDRLMEFAC